MNVERLRKSIEKDVPPVKGKTFKYLSEYFKILHAGKNRGVVQHKELAPSP